MKIAYIHSGFFPSNSPCMTFTTLNAIALAEVFEHCYFFIKRNSNDFSAEILKKHFNLKQPQNLSIYQIKNNKFINTNYFYFKNVYHKIEDLIARNKLRVVISRNITFLPYLAKIKKKFGIATYFETHDFYADLSVRNDVNKNKKARYERFERKYIPQISGVFCLQHAQKELYQKIFPEQKFFVVRTGLDKINRHSNEKRFYLSYIGSFDAHKVVDIFIKACNLSKSKPPSLNIG